ncbi:MAG: peptidylprolyl isomerase, partial [Gammaproteobacteria bacterium]
MLQTIHDKAKGLFAYIILILISIPFALWGIQSYFEGGGKKLAAEVNGKEIPVRAYEQALREKRNQLRQAFGGRIPEGYLDEGLLQQQALADVIREHLLAQELEQAGYRIGDRQLARIIHGLPVFQNNGRFDKALYDRLLSTQRLSKAGFELQVRIQSLRQQFRTGIAGTAFLPASYKRDYLRLAEQTRNFDEGRIDPGQYAKQAEPTEKEIADWYQAHRQEYLTPEQVRIDYVRLSQAALARQIQVGDEEIRAAYEEQQDSLRTPERRHLRNILLRVDKDHPEAEVRKRIEGLRKQIHSLADFERLARTVSQDRVTAPRGGDLGEVEPGELEEVVDRTAFALDKGKVSEPLRTARGYELIMVEDIVPSRIQRLDEVRSRLARELAERSAENRFLDLSEKLGTLAYEVPDTLDDAAEAIGAQVERSEWFSREQGQGIAASPSVREAAFLPEVLKERNNSELIELSPGEVVVLRVAEHRPPAERPLEEVREAIRARLRQQKMRELARQEGERLLQSLRAGKLEWDGLARKGVRLHAYNDVRRDQAEGVAPEVLKRVFRMNRPQAQPTLSG